MAGSSVSRAEARGIVYEIVLGTITGGCTYALTLSRTGLLSGCSVVGYRSCTRINTRVSWDRQPPAGGQVIDAIRVGRQSASPSFRPRHLFPPRRVSQCGFSSDSLILKTRVRDPERDNEGKTSYLTREKFCTHSGIPRP